MLKKLLLLALLAATVIATYKWFDVAVSLDHARQQQKTDRERTELLYQLVPALGAKRSQVKQVVQQKFGKEHIIKEEQNRIMLDNIVFEFDDAGTLVDLHSLDVDGTARAREQ